MSAPFLAEELVVGVEFRIRGVGIGLFESVDTVFKEAVQSIGDGVGVYTDKGGDFVAIGDVPVDEQYDFGSSLYGGDGMSEAERAELFELLGGRMDGEHVAFLSQAGMQLPPKSYLLYTLNFSQLQPNGCIIHVGRFFGLFSVHGFTRERVKNIRQTIYDTGRPYQFRFRVPAPCGRLDDQWRCHRFLAKRQPIWRKIEGKV